MTDIRTDSAAHRGDEFRPERNGRTSLRRDWGRACHIDAITFSHGHGRLRIAQAWSFGTRLVREIAESSRCETARGLL